MITQNSPRVENSPDNATVRLAVIERFPWRKHHLGNEDIWIAGNEKGPLTLAAIPEGPDLPERVAQVASQLDDHFAVIADRADGILAVTDHCRSYPIFYASDTSCVIGNDARAVRDVAGLSKPDLDSICEAAMSGFVTGTNTLIEGLQQLAPGSVLFAPAGNRAVSTIRSFIYQPSGHQTESFSANSESVFTSSIDAAIDRILLEAKTAPIWVPLSGGLDSRLVLAKLKSRGCTNLHSFSYGSTGNSDAIVARNIAHRLEVPWRFVSTKGRHARAFFKSEKRREYWNFADGLSSVPNNQDLLPLLQLRESSVLSDDAIVINGQTGDFISGGHIPSWLFQKHLTVGKLISEIIAQHYSLWRSIMTPKNIAAVTKRIRAALTLGEPNNETLDTAEAIALWERFEYEGRQARYIVNGQRSYDFLGLRWALPLWDGEVVRFWRDMPPDVKRDQRLYRETCGSWDWEGVFSIPTRPVTAWSRPLSAAIVPISIAMRLLVGRTQRDQLITYARYFDRFGTHYQAFGWPTFARHASDTRNSVSYYARAWLDELALPWPDDSAFL